MTRMNMNQWARMAVVSGAFLAVCGCSHHDAAPETPSVSSATPTYRSQTNSDVPNNTPNFTQPGVNHGAPATLPVIAKADRFDQNSPLAGQVFSAIQRDSTISSRYLTVDTKGGVVRLSGTASAADAAAAEKLVKSQKGVTSVIDKIEIK